ncbi:P-loop containing nucleoside triphosphate hydrolase protein [Yarrowia lipolytica]|jgi:Ras family protein|uniref:YALI0E30943p n=2 Tax=Yarrowia lipolytica TaxID=4952 RepID=Q6C400_YARLI|nr:YALI0E30943p [Yarrowia lipolytica CLIB122]AOW06204.1 hypothetical protein YALI1_E36404g [Yarrowia lipolytica]KAB8285529.1 P-loop containing nucleoside triphosphate hydrolase protein [Yarrowia lipolytica]KAE8175382.1 P-loop containing nucleoside triphosphate hydrolase protein [Yarrowia lipolytica]KAJ8057590.1 P-loop containing nucleoside triphosphate hydrolase protein [Yarrowia lipolytica]QNP99818.1 GTP-binding protein rhb1 [Yarrowia lipolytica]|eukprot:XP_504612.1 YALI0E30943p [Yarrowia lipolytica CLIB122]
MAAQRARKIAVVGSRAVGKSSMTVQFVEQHFVESYYPTIENQFSKTIVYKGIEYNTEIIDTAGQDEFSIMNQKHLLGVHGYLLVYSVTSRSTFDVLPIIHDKILNATGSSSIPLVIVGNKSDLDSQRQVSVEEAKELAASWGGAFVETSARDGTNVAKAFELLVEEIEKTQNKTDPAAQNKNCIVM